MIEWRLAGPLAAVLATGCAHSAAGDAPGGRYMAGHFRADAVLHPSAGTAAGTAVAQEDHGALRVTVEVEGLPPGVHGVHVHTTGKCEVPDFASAGGHWNPGAKQHGSLNPMGAHMGDLPNLTVGADGKGRLVFTIPAASQEALLDADGAAIVVHAAADDLKTDPSGNSGARIACGVFGAV